MHPCRNPQRVSGGARSRWHRQELSRRFAFCACVANHSFFQHASPVSLPALRARQLWYRPASRDDTSDRCPLDSHRRDSGDARCVECGHRSPRCRRFGGGHAAGVPRHLGAVPGAPIHRLGVRGAHEAIRGLQHAWLCADSHADRDQRDRSDCRGAWPMGGTMAPSGRDSSDNWIILRDVATHA